MYRPSYQDLFAKSDDRIISEKLPIQYAYRAEREWVNDRSAFLPPALTQVTTLQMLRMGLEGRLPARLASSHCRSHITRLTVAFEDSFIDSLGIVYGQFTLSSATTKQNARSSTTCASFMSTPEPCDLQPGQKLCLFSFMPCRVIEICNSYTIWSSSFQAYRKGLARANWHGDS
jgi:hypothetical protein